MKRLIVLLLPALLAGCATSIERRDEFVNARIEASRSVYVALPEDGSSHGRVVPGSGEKTQGMLTRILSTYLRNVTNGQQVESTAEAMAAARARGGHFLFVPRILHWEDHRTEYSGRRDRVEVEMWPGAMSLPQPQWAEWAPSGRRAANGRRICWRNRPAYSS